MAKNRRRRSLSSPDLEESLGEVLKSDAPTPEQEISSGYVVDYVSGQQVRETPEEVYAVQVFARRLVDDFGYPKDCLITRPQYRVRRRPSETRKSYPVDIAVFSHNRKQDTDLRMIVECKADSEKTGRRQLELYLSMSEAQLGVWFNGVSHLYLRKDYLPGGQIVFTTIRTLPRYGQRWEDIGLYLRKDLKTTEHLRPVLRDIRNHLAGNVTGITRDESLAQQIINILLCKVYDERLTGPEELVSFRAGLNEPAAQVRERLFDLFAAVKARYQDVFDATDSIELDDDNIAYVVGELQTYCVTEAKRDVIGEAFEVFIGPALRGRKGSSLLLAM